MKEGALFLWAFKQNLQNGEAGGLLTGGDEWEQDLQGALFHLLCYHYEGLPAGIICAEQDVQEAYHETVLK
jgi:hypothetical protein